MRRSLKDGVFQGCNKRKLGPRNRKTWLRTHKIIAPAITGRSSWAEAGLRVVVERTSSASPSGRKRRLPVSVTAGVDRLNPIREMVEITLGCGGDLFGCVRSRRPGRQRGEIWVMELVASRSG